jgi:hypothetical protein
MTGNIADLWIKTLSPVWLPGVLLFLLFSSLGEHLMPSAADAISQPDLS